MERRYIRISELASSPKKRGRWPVSPATVWRWVKSGVLPPPVRLGPQVAAWPMEVIEAYEAAQAAAAPVQTEQKADAGRASVAARRAKAAAEVPA